MKNLKKLSNPIFSRFESLIGTESLQKLSSKKVLVIGCGGVGGYVCEGLIRSGVGTIILVDHDIVDETNLNRQIIALHSTIGQKKVEVLKERILDINKECKVITHDLFLEEGNIDTIFEEDIDYVIDACDTVKTKQALIKKSLEKDIPFISSMGTARKLDPTKLEITDIRKTKNDPLARIMRKFISIEKINKKVMVLSSTELPKPCTDNILGSTAFVPSSAGLLISSYVIKKLIEK